jgi:hypothetical protein
MDSATTAAPPPPPQPMVVIHRYHGGTSSFGPLIVALAVITVLGALAVLMGRVCFGRRSLFGYGRYDLEAWVETKCASCVDGRMDVALPRPRHVAPPPPAAASPPPAQPPPPEAEATNGADAEKEPERRQGTISES